MRNFLKIATGFDVTPLLFSLNRQSNLWGMDRYWKDHPVPVFRDVDTIMLRFPEKIPYEFESDQKRFEYLSGIDQMECSDQTAMDFLPESRPIIFGLMARVQGERLGRVMINRLPPGASIPAHSDVDPINKYYDRFHCVLQSNPLVSFMCGDELFPMQSGEIFWFENALEHSVQNNGNEDRISLIIDVKSRGNYAAP